MPRKMSPYIKVDSDHRNLSHFIQFLKCLLLNYCQTPLQLANPTQLQLVRVGVVEVDFIFPRKKEGGGKNNPHLEGITLHV